MKGFVNRVMWCVCMACAGTAVFANPPTIAYYGPQQIYVGEHQTYTIRCRASGGALAYRWWHQEPDAAQGHAIPYGEGFDVDRPKLSVPDAAPNRDYNGAYWCVVTNMRTGEIATSPRTQVTVVRPPRITRHPSEQRKHVGESATFTVQADPGAPVPVKYQWYHDEKKLAGAKEQTLNISNVTEKKAGYYFCRVTTVGGSTDSGGAPLVIVSGSAPANETQPEEPPDTEPPLLELP
jgi:hypothetical protein